MKEPILTYKKGEGWIYLPDDYFCEAVTRDGVRCKVFGRDPVIGDLYVARYSHDTEEVIKDYIAANYAANWKPWGITNRLIPNQNHYWVVVLEYTIG